MSLEGLSREELIARLRAAQASERPAEAPPGKRDVEGVEEKDRLLHELQVHQTELEIQNRELREAQGALEESRSRYADLYDFAPVSYYTFDSRGVVLEVNLTGATMVGLERTQILGLPFLALVRMEDPGQFWQHLRQAARSRGPVVAELGFSLRDRPSIVVQAVSTAVRAPSGEVVRFRTGFTDISQRIAGEAEQRRLQEAERRLRRHFEALDKAGLAISTALAQFSDESLDTLLQVIVDQARLLVDADYAALGFGTDPDQRFSPWVSRGMPAEAAAKIGHGPRAVGLLGLVARGDSPVRVKNLREHPAFSGFPEHHPLMTSFLGVPIVFGGRTIGTLYLADKRGAPEFSEDDEWACAMLATRAGLSLEVARLRASEASKRARLSILSEAGAALAASLDLTATLHAVAKVAVPRFADYCMVHLVEEGEIRDVAVAHADPAQEPAVAELARLVPSAAGEDGSVFGQVVTGRRPVLIPDFRQEQERRPDLLQPSIARLRTGSLLVVPFLAREQLLGALSLGYADSGRRYGEADLVLAEELAHRAATAIENARLYEDAKAAIQARDNVLAVVSHDLRSPLNAIFLISGLLARTPEGAERRRIQHHVEIIRRAADRMNRLIGDLLQAATIEAGRFSVEPRPTPTVPLLEDCLLLAEPLCAQKSLKLEREVPRALPPVACDRERVMQVVSNLVGNAVKFTPEGGTVRVGAEPLADEVRFFVADTGPGIPEDELDHLFQRYWKGQPSGRHGTGLGLYIAKGIVEAHGGRLWVETRVGAGSTFSFTLQVVPGHAA